MKNPMNDLSFHCTLCSSNENYILYFPIPHNALRLGGQAEIQDG